MLTKEIILSSKQKPKHYRIESSNIPEFLKKQSRWICWRWDRRLKRGVAKWAKVPVDPNRCKRMSVTSGCYYSFDQATSRYYASQRVGDGKVDGIGFVFVEGDEITGTDLDNCRDIDTGETEGREQSIVKQLDTYAEVSPSGTGVKLFLRGTLPDRFGNRQGNIEVYSHGRFFVVTGHRLEGSPATVNDRQAELEAFAAQHLPIVERHRERQQQPAGEQRPVREFIHLADSDILSKAMQDHRFARLWTGNTSSHDNDQSRADLALCCKLAFWTGGDASKIDQLFRQSGLYRQKWDESRGGQTYGQRTISRALARVTDYYRPFEHDHDDGWQVRWKRPEPKPIDLAIYAPPPGVTPVNRLADPRFQAPTLAKIQADLANQPEETLGALGCHKQCRCPHTRKVLMRHEDGRCRINYFPCERLDCLVCSKYKREQYKATVRHHLGKLPVDDAQSLYLFHVAAGREWTNIAERIRKRGGSYFRLDEHASNYFTVVSTVPPASCQVSPQYVHPITPQAAIAYLCNAIDNLPLVSKKLLASSRKWKLLVDDKKTETGWKIVGEAPMAKPQAVTQILVARGISYKWVNRPQTFFSWNAIQFQTSFPAWKLRRLWDEISEGDLLYSTEEFHRPPSSVEDVKIDPREFDIENTSGFWMDIEAG